MADHLAVMLEATGFSTFYLAGFGGTDLFGGGAGIRATYLQKSDGHGLYLTPSLRMEYVGGARDGHPARGVATATGLTIGQAFRPTKTIDVRLGFGGQLIKYDMRTTAGKLYATTPFIAFEIVIGFRR